MDITKAKNSVIKHYGEGIVMIPSQSKIFDKCICSTGLVGLDDALGTTGIPTERMIEIYGPESGGKTTLALLLAKAVQKAGGDVTFVDVEHVLDTNYAKNGLGVDVDNMLISQPDYGEQAIDLVYQLLKIQKKNPKRPHLFIIDSVDALIPKKELDCDFDIKYDENGKKVKKSGGGLGMRARLMSDACRRLTSHLKGTNSTIVFINQIRMKIGVVFGNPEVTSGGNALKFYASIRMDIRNIGQYKVSDVIVGNMFRIKIVKNKCAPPFKIYEGLNIHGKGFQLHWDLYETLSTRKLLVKKGSWKQVEGIDKNFQGYDGFCELIEDKKILARCRKLLK